MSKIIVRAGSGRYDVTVRRGALNDVGSVFSSQYGGARVFVVSDETVWGLYGVAVSTLLDAAGVRFRAEIVPPGERSKSAETLFRLYTALAKGSYSRSDFVLALGGGVVGDLAGMAAATYLRGMRFAQAPTTLLAQVDSSIGGKVAVDLPEGKNLVGAFHQPKFVLVDPDALDTLPDREFACGMAEVIKHAAIRDAQLFARLEKHGGRERIRRILPSVILSNLRIKRDVVRTDERDDGPRMVLNFGHTVGHALEKQSGYEGMSHGEAVAVGMVRMAKAGEAMGCTEPGTASRLEALCRSFGLPVEMPGSARGALLETMGRDKKIRGGRVTLVLLRRIGECFLHTVGTDELGRFL